MNWAKVFGPDSGLKIYKQKFGLAQNNLGPVEGQGIKILKFEESTHQIGHQFAYIEEGLPRT